MLCGTPKGRREDLELRGCTTPAATSKTLLLGAADHAGSGPFLIHQKRAGFNVITVSDAAGQAPYWGPMLGGTQVACCKGSGLSACSPQPKTRASGRSRVFAALPPPLDFPAWERPEVWPDDFSSQGGIRALTPLPGPHFDTRLNPRPSFFLFSSFCLQMQLQAARTAFASNLVQVASWSKLPYLVPFLARGFATPAAAVTRS